MDKLDKVKDIIADYKNKSNNPGILSELDGKVENFYSN
jgi:hypothetical protein